MALDTTTTIITKRKANHNRALLDKKFVIMQESPSLKIENSSPSLTQLSKSPIAVKSYPKVNNKRRVSPPTKLESKPSGDNWDDYAQEVELDESLSVGAKLINY